MTAAVRLLATLALALSLTGPAHAQAASGKLMRATGPVTVNGQPVKAGAVLKAGDRLVTGPQSRADVTLSDGSAILVYEGSTLTLSKLGRQIRLNLAKGSALNAVHKGSDYRMTSPSAIAAVRGTVFYLKSDSKQSNICVCEGSVAVGDPTTKLSETFTTKHHEAFDVGGGSILPGAMVGHTDQEAAALLKLRR